jgi:hypothetical protein
MFAFSPLKLTTAVAAALLLAACAAEPSGPAAGGPAAGGATPEAGRALPPPDPDAPSTQGDLSTSPVAPAEVPGAGETAGSEAASETVVIEGPDGTTWVVRSPRDEEAYRADVEDCYRYAVGQTRRDALMMNDRNAGIDTLTSESRYSQLRQRVDEFELRNRRADLMSSCMEAKGYARADTVLPRLEF